MTQPLIEQSATPRPYYDHGGITLYHGDCRDVLPTFQRGLVDLVLTDPPYNAGLSYDVHVDSMPRDEYIEWCRDWFEKVRAVCARTIIFPGNGNLPVWWDVSKPSAVGCWYKPGNARSSVIGWEEWEPWLYWTGDKGLLGGSSVVRSPVGAQVGVDGHPCPKPLDLFKRLMLKTKTAAVLDPFCGAGTTLRAAKDLGLRAIGVELSEAYCEIAVRRLGQEVFDLAA